MTLTKRQTRILTMLSEGKLQKEIASAIGVRESTLKCYLMRLRARFGASNLTQLVVFFVSLRCAPKRGH